MRPPEVRRCLRIGVGEFFERERNVARVLDLDFVVDDVAHLPSQRFGHEAAARTFDFLVLLDFEVEFLFFRFDFDRR